MLGVNSLAGVSIHEPIFLVASLIPMLTHDCREGKNHLRVSGRFSRTWQKPPGLFSAWVCLALKTYNKIVKHFRQSSFICYVLKSDWNFDWKIRKGKDKYKPSIVLSSTVHQGARLLYMSITLLGTDFNINLDVLAFTFFKVGKKLNFKSRTRIGHFCLFILNCDFVMIVRLLDQIQKCSSLFH